MKILSMDTLRWIGILIGFLALIWMTYISLQYMIHLIKGKKYSPRPLFRDFRQKMWMTVGLGVPFFGFYLALVLFGSSLIDSQTGQQLFLLFYKHPTEFIYLGLFIFACLSLSVYFVRMFIKYFYLNKSKDS